MKYTAILKHLALWSIPLLMIMVMALLSSLAPTGSSQSAAKDAPAKIAKQRKGRLVVVIVDSLRRKTVDAHMPRLKRWAKTHDAIDLDVRTCSANYTVPCVQTLMEGRQSPFVAGLHNFTGKKSGNTSLPAQLKRAGAHQILISDFTLDTLYGAHAQTSLNVENWPGNWLKHDRRAVKEAKELLEKTPSLDMMVLHLVGTDKIAHRRTPKHPQYAKHHAIVDEDIHSLLQMLSPDDHVIITGDHGHDEKGHHTRDSLVMMRSPLIKQLLTTPVTPVLEQHEITYFFWFVLGLPITPAYEGRYFGLEHPPASATPEFAAHLKRFGSLQRNALTNAGFVDNALKTQITNKRKQMRQAPLRSALRYSPMVIIYLWWIFWMIASAQHSRWRGVVIACLANTATLTLGMFVPPAAMAILAGVLLLAMGKHLWPITTAGQKRLFSWLIFLLTIGALAALSGPRWAGFWHTKGGFQLTTPMFFVGLIALGLIGSKWRSNTWWGYMPEALGATCLIALPSGVYFYQYGQNIIRGFFIGALFLAVGVVIRRMTRRTQPSELALTWGWRDGLALALLVVTGGLLMHQTAGGWEWHFVLTRSLKKSHKAIPALIYASFALTALAILRPTLKSLMGWLLLWSLPMLYSAYIGQLTLATMAGVSVPMAFAFAFARLTITPILRASTEHDQERVGWWLLAIGVLTLWITLSGFFIGQVDFNFTFPYLSMFKKESTVAFWSSWMTLAKYMFPSWVWVFALFWFRKPTQWVDQMGWFWALLHIKCLALFLHIFAGPLLSEQKLFELSISELMFTMTVGWMTIAATLVIALVYKAFMTPEQGDTSPASDEHTASS